MAWKGHPPGATAEEEAEEATVVVLTGDDFDHDPSPYDFFFVGVVGALMNASDFETVLALLASSHGFLVATPPPDDDDGDDLLLFHEPMP